MTQDNPGFCIVVVDQHDCARDAAKAAIGIIFPTAEIVLEKDSQKGYEYIRQCISIDRRCVVICGYGHMRSHESILLIKNIRKLCAQTCIVVMSGFLETGQPLLQIGADYFIRKPHVVGGLEKIFNDPKWSKSFL